MLLDELRTILRELVASTGAENAAIIPSQEGQGAAQQGEGRIRCAPLGFGATLVVELPSPAAKSEQAAAGIERATRAIRAAARRYQVSSLPSSRFTAQPSDPRQQTLERMQAFLAAFCGSTGADVAAVVHHGQLIAASSPLDELQIERLPFIVRLVDAEAQKQVGTSHAVVFQPDYFAATFYYGAALVAFTSRALAEDFVKQHARRVTRELVHLLELLDDGPPDPAHVIPT